MIIPAKLNTCGVFKKNVCQKVLIFSVAERTETLRKVTEEAETEENRIDI